MMNAKYHPNGLLVYEGFLAMYNQKENPDTHVGGRVTITKPGRVGHNYATFLVAKIDRGPTEDTYRAYAVELNSPIYEAWEEQGLLPIAKSEG